MLTLFHDYIAPASAIAVARFQRLADEGAAVRFAGFPALGVDLALPVSLDVLGDLDRLDREAAAEGLVLRRPPALYPTALAHVLADVAEQQGLGASWRGVSYRAYWEAGADLSSEPTLAALAEEAGLQRAAVAAALQDRVALVRVRQRLAAYRREGVGGVPMLLAQRTLIPALLPLSELRVLARLG